MHLSYVYGLCTNSNHLFGPLRGLCWLLYIILYYYYYINDIIILPPCPSSLFLPFPSLHFSASEIDRILATRPTTDKIVISFQTDLRASLAKEIALDLLESSKVTVYSARTTSKLARQYGGQRPDTIVLVDR